MSNYVSVTEKERDINIIFIKLSKSSLILNLNGKKLARTLSKTDRALAVGKVHCPCTEELRVASSHVVSVQGPYPSHTQRWLWSRLAP